MENPHKRQLRRGCPNKGKRSNSEVWCVECYRNFRGKSNVKGHVAYRPLPKPYVPFERYVMKRPEGKVAGGPAGNLGLCSDEQFGKKFPTIVQYLTDDKYDDGGAREVSVLSISIREGQIALALNDKDLKQSMYSQDETLQGCLKLLEGALGGAGQWRPWKAGKKR